MKTLLSCHTTPCFIVVFLLLLFSGDSYSTTVVVIASRSGIVVATDSKIGVTDYKGVKAGSTGGTKVFVIQHRLAIASIGKAFYSYRDAIAHQSMGDYSFPTWIHSIEGRLPNDISFDDFVGVVKGEIGNMIPTVQRAVSRGGERQQTVNNFEPFIQYVIAGYQDRIPKLCVLELYIDWDRKTVLGPYQTPLDTTTPAVGNIRPNFFGVQQTIADFLNRDSYAYKQAMVMCPKAFKDLIANRSITLNETSAFAKTLVQIEEQTSPNVVGGQVRTVQITPTTGARDLIENLPKATPTKHKTTK